MLRIIHILNNLQSNQMVGFNNKNTTLNVVFKQTKFWGFNR